MAKRKYKRTNGDGSIFERKINGRINYVGQVTIGYDSSGEQVRKSFSSYSKQEVIDKMTELKYEVNTGRVSVSSTIPLNSWFYKWLFEYRKFDLKPTTFERYEGLYRNYIKKSIIANIPLNQVKTNDLQRYLIALIDEDEITITTAHMIKKVLVTCFNHAIKEGLIYRNVASNVTLPKKPKPDAYPVLSKEEQLKVLSVLDNDVYGIAIKLAFATGARLGELRALTWSDIDFINERLYVEKQLQDLYEFDNQSTKTLSYKVTTPKTEESIRSIPIPKNVLHDLREYKNIQNIIKMENMDIYDDMDLIIANDMGMPFTKKVLPDNFKRACLKAGVRPIKFHGIRHTYATRLFEADVPVKTVQVLLGHSSSATTLNVYTHVMPEQKSIAAQAINDLFI